MHCNLLWNMSRRLVSNWIFLLLVAWVSDECISGHAWTSHSYRFAGFRPWNYGHYSRLACWHIYVNQIFRILQVSP
jgi:hypothetical protein